ncbi:endonuclease VII domain-containing protein [Geodermatophilus sp. URMC 63]
MNFKYCRDCGEERPVAEFTRNRNSRDGLASSCRVHARRRHRRSRDERVGMPARRHPRDVVVPEGHKWCPDCGMVLPLSSLGRNAAASSGVDSYCRPCHNARGRASKDEIGGSSTYHLRRRYGITAEEVDAMFAKQGGRCAICRRAPALHVDHDHRTGEVWALLCSGCTGGLGQVKDDPDAWHAAAYYVAVHEARQDVLAAMRPPSRS